MGNALMVQYAVLGSGSSGNSYLFTDGTVSILIDQGYSVVELTRRLSQFSVPLSTVQAVFLTHLHPDHARGVGVLSRRLPIPVYAHDRMVAEQPLLIEKLGIPEGRLQTVCTSELVEVGPFSLFCFETSHDSGGSVGWYITHQDTHYMVLTDTGITSEQQMMLAGDANILFLEANYDEQMLRTGPYPAMLKRRISGNHGHLSNDQALQFLCESGFKGEHVYFIHLSECNNDPVILEKVVQSMTDLPFTVCRKNQWYGPKNEVHL
ncbi:MBL fold metallo-hydrolase [Sphaerochaeta sp. S2]|uniref:MBL fold metallo-hydrolase n=1 Tax=Sphaerochaeta sp. S2 TaxID=2798868 RepID=UPI001E400934|nr:MBL fold metallo-hydrolase [Sphaerochaeta sp. S2]